MVRAIVITGSPGAGKTSVLEALYGLLDHDGVPHAALESEQLGWGTPWLTEEQTHELLAELCVALRRHGRELFLIAGTTVTSAHVASIVGAIGADRTTVVCLRAAPETAARRVMEREPPEWHGREALAGRARELATQIPALDGIDLHISTEGRHPQRRRAGDPLKDARGSLSRA